MNYTSDEAICQLIHSYDNMKCRFRENIIILYLRCNTKREFPLNSKLLNRFRNGSHNYLKKLKEKTIFITFHS